MSLAESLERAAVALPADADAIRPANGDGVRLAELLDRSAARRVFGWLLAHEPEAAGELAEIWLEREDGLAVLAEIDQSALPKQGRKLLRRALHRARTQGHAVAGTAAPPRSPKVARLPKLEERLDAAYVAPYDPRGARLVYLVESAPGGGARLFEALLDPLRGLVDFQVYRANRRQVRQFVRDILRRERYACVEAASASVRALLAASVERHAPDRPLPRSFVEFRGRLLEGAQNAPAPGQHAREALGSESDEASEVATAAQALEQRVRAGELGPWPPAPERLAASVDAIHARVEAGQLDAGDDGALQAALRESTEALYRGEIGEAMGERLDEMAYIFWKREETSEARASLAAADAFRSGVFGRDGVVRAMIDVVFEALLADLRSKLGTGEAEQPESDARAAGGAKEEARTRLPRKTKVDE